MKRALILASAAVASLTAASFAIAESDTNVTVKGGKADVTAPYTTVDSTPARTKVKVDAPHTNVKVDTEARVVKIRVPFFNGDIRW
ncbi:MAG TPA: hypothetical protein PK970_13300 [Hyphomicrobiaceae bacterium]|nr:hypothetical protein [Hyphomicrobiaceae bacterium]